MPQTTELITTLNKLLKRHNKTYVDVAACLQLSEASVKRLTGITNVYLVISASHVKEAKHEPTPLHPRLG